MCVCERARERERERENEKERIRVARKAMVFLKKFKDKITIKWEESGF